MSLLLLSSPGTSCLIDTGFYDRDAISEVLSSLRCCVIERLTAQAKLGVTDARWLLLESILWYTALKRDRGATRYQFA